MKRNFPLLISKVSEFTFTLTQVVYAAITETVVFVGNYNPVMQSRNYEEANT